MKLGEVLVYVVHIEYYSIKKFYQILMKNKKVVYRTHSTGGLSVHRDRWIVPSSQMLTLELWYNFEWISSLTEIIWVILKIRSGKKFLFAHEFGMSMGCKNL